MVGAGLGGRFRRNRSHQRSHAKVMDRVNDPVHWATERPSLQTRRVKPAILGCEDARLSYPTVPSSLPETRVPGDSPVEHNRYRDTHGSDAVEQHSIFRDSWRCIPKHDEVRLRSAAFCKHFVKSLILQLIVYFRKTFVECGSEVPNCVDLIRSCLKSTPKQVHMIWHQTIDGTVK